MTRSLKEMIYVGMVKNTYSLRHFRSRDRRITSSGQLRKDSKTPSQKQNKKKKQRAGRVVQVVEYFHAYHAQGPGFNHSHAGK
jgi:hypothetical protein